MNSFSKKLGLAAIAAISLAGLTGCGGGGSSTTTVVYPKWSHAGKTGYYIVVTSCSSYATAACYCDSTGCWYDDSGWYNTNGGYYTGYWPADTSYVGNSSNTGTVYYSGGSTSYPTGATSAYGNSSNSSSSYSSPSYSSGSTSATGNSSNSSSSYSSPSYSSGSTSATGNSSNSSSSYSSPSYSSGSTSATGNSSNSSSSYSSPSYSSGSTSATGNSSNSSSSYSSPSYNSGSTSYAGNSANSSSYNTSSYGGSSSSSSPSSTSAYGNSSNTSATYSVDGQTKDTDLQNAEAQAAALSDKAQAMASQYQMDFSAAMQLTQLQDRFQSLSKAGKLTDDDRAAIIDKTLGLANITQADIAEAMKSGDVKALDAMIEKGAQNLGMPNSAALRDQILPSLGIQM